MLRQAIIVGLLAIAVPAVAQPLRAPAGAAPGSLVEATPLAGAPAGARGFKIRYRTLDTDNRPIIVSGVIIVPAGRAPTGGRDVIAWAHGTSGVAQQCAPSDNPALFQSIAGLEAMLAAGYVVAATDYQGLGNPGPHPYLVGSATAQAVLDSVRAAAGVPRARPSGRFAVWGESQGGHAALWTGRLAGTYAPELRLVGVAAAAPPTDLKANLTGGTNAAVRALLTAYTADSWNKTYGIPLSTIARPVGRDLITRLARNCVTLDGFKLRTQIGLVRLTGQLRGVDISQSPPWAARIAANSAPARGFTVPLLIAQGGKDAIVAPGVTRGYIERLCRAGASVRIVEIADGDHITLGKRAAPTAIAWLDSLFGNKRVRNDCA